MKIKLLFILNVLLFAMCSQKESKSLNGEITGLLDRAIREKQISISLASVNVEWDSLIVLPPYSNVAGTSKFFGVDLSAISETGIQERDNICVLVFLIHGQVASFTAFSRATYDFAFLPSNSYFVPKDKFQMKRDASSPNPRYIITLR